MKTEQEKFWMNKFGNSYSKRNKKRNTKNFYKKILLKTGKIKSAFEIGTNIGLNLDELKKIDHKIKTFGVEINRFAYERCYEKGHQVFNDSIFDFKINKKYDLVFSTTSKLMTGFLGALVSRYLNIKFYLDIRDIFYETIKYNYSKSVFKKSK